MNKVDIQDYEKEIESEEYEKIYNDLFNKSMDLIEKIEKIKGYKIPKKQIGITLFNNIQYFFDCDSIQFSEIYYLIEEFRNWNKKDEEVNCNFKRKIANIIMRYNNIIDELELYKNVEKEVKEKGLKTTIKDREEKYAKEFKEKLSGKKKKVDESFDIVRLVRKVVKNTKLDYDEINDVEKVLLMDDVYNYIMIKGYKKVDAIYSNEYMGYK